MRITGGVHGVKIENSSAKSNTEHATAYGTQAKICPSERTFAPPLVLSSCVNAVSKVLSRRFQMTVFISFSI